MLTGWELPFLKLSVHNVLIYSSVFICILNFIISVSIVSIIFFPASTWIFVLPLSLKFSHNHFLLSHHFCFNRISCHLLSICYLFYHLQTQKQECQVLMHLIYLNPLNYFLLLALINDLWK